jgi:hypothetical protein
LAFCACGSVPYAEFPTKGDGEVKVRERDTEWEREREREREGESERETSHCKCLASRLGLLCGGDLQI